MVKTRFLLIIFSIAVLAAYFTFLIIPVSKGYNYFTEFAAELLNKKQRLEAIRNTFPEGRFILIQRLVYGVGFVITILLAAALYYSKALSLFIRRVTVRVSESYRSFVAILKDIDAPAKAIFSFVVIYLIVQSLWYITHLPFIHDEAYTIRSFVLPGPVAAVTFYPYPNNHILFSLFSYPFSFLPLKPEIAFRLPALIAVVATCFVLFKLLLLFLKAVQAALGVVMFVFMLPVTAYAVFARGYCLVFLFTGLSIYSLCRIIESNSYYHRVLLIIFSVLGLYTVPSYMYPFAAVYGVYFGYSITTGNKKLIKNVVVSGLLCGLFTIILYLPVIITSGGWTNFVKVLYFGYDYTPSISVIKIFMESVYALHFFERNILGIILFIVTVVVGLGLIKKARSSTFTLVDRVFFFTCLLGFLIPIISFLIQRKMVAPRTHNYAALFFVGFVFIAIKVGVRVKWRQYAFVAATLSIMLMHIIFAHSSILLKGEEYNDKTADLFATRMLTHANKTDTCYTFDLFYLATIQLKYGLVKRPLTVYQSQPGSPSSAAFDYSKNYPWIITTKNEVNLNSDSLRQMYVPVIDRNDGTLWKKIE
ncbi:MAG: hypothetical protein JWQ96_1026 [Segetibacter sp.]|nr:hypothetical protein [Segetibacter sp.]